MSDLQLSDGDFAEMLIKHMVRHPDVYRRCRQLNVVGQDFVLDDVFGEQIYKEFVDTINHINATPILQDTLIRHIANKVEDGVIEASKNEQLAELLGYIYDTPLDNPEFFYKRLPEYLHKRRSKRALVEHIDNPAELLAQLNKVQFQLDTASSSDQVRIVHPFKDIIYKSQTKLIGTNLRKLDEKIEGLQLGEYALLIGFSGGGKCHGKGTKILMADGSVKLVEDICVHDKVMGPDSTPRNVLSLVRGEEQMYKITPIKGESWTCNESHMLSLVSCSKNYPKLFKQDEIVNISVKDYLALPKDARSMLKQYRTGVDFPTKPVGLDPYMLGCWLGDGARRAPKITNIDPEVVAAIHAWGAKHNHRVNKYEDDYSFSAKPEKNIFFAETQKCRVNDVKRIPTSYLINSRRTRLQLLAGLLDTDGHLHHNFYEIISKYDGLAEDILYLARSLGFAAYNHPKIATMRRKDGTVYKCRVNRINISGHVNKIPCKIARKKAATRKQVKNVLRTGFAIRKIKTKDYYGFELDGDHLYLLGDFTVTHNSACGSNIVCACAEVGTNATYISCEDTLENMTMRFYSKVFQIPYQQLRKGEANIELEAKNSELDVLKKNKLANCLSLHSVKGVSEITPDFLYSKMVQEYEETGFVPTLVMLDQMQFVTPNTQTKKSAQGWEIEKLVSAELDELSHKKIGGRGFVLWVQHQAKGKLKKRFTREDIDGFKGIIQKCDLAVGVGRDPNNGSELDLFSIKVRHTADFGITLRANLQYMDISSDIGDTALGNYNQPTSNPSIPQLPELPHNPMAQL